MGLEVVGLEVVGLEVVGLEVVDLEVVDLEVVGLEVLDLEVGGVERARRAVWALRAWLRMAMRKASLGAANPMAKNWSSERRIRIPNRFLASE